MKSSDYSVNEIYIHKEFFAEKSDFMISMNIYAISASVSKKYSV